MLQFSHKAGNILHYEVRGRLTAADLRGYYTVIDRQYREYGKLRLLVEVHDFRGYENMGALLVFLRREAGLLLKVQRYAAVTDKAWFRRLINGLNYLIPGISFRAFSQAKRAQALKWLSN